MLIQKAIIFVLSASLAAGLLVSCSKDKEDKPKSKLEPAIDSWQKNTSNKSIIKISVQNNLKQPLYPAQILIGTELNRPFANNFFETDKTGVATVPASLWSEALPITVHAPGHVRVTYFAQRPEDITFQLRPLPQNQGYEISGHTTGYKIVDKDDKIDFAVVMPALTRQDLLGFDVQRIISSQMDQIEIVGQKIKIPSNVALPKQKESYFLPITINKPEYKIFVDNLGEHKIYALKGRFPFKSVVDSMLAKKEFYDLFNLFTIESSVLRNYQVSSIKNSLNLPVNEFIFQSKWNYQAPHIKTDDILMVATVEEQDGYLLPLDIKNLDSLEKGKLNIKNPQNTLLVSALKKKNPDKESTLNQMSVSVADLETAKNLQHLDYIEKPQIINNTLTVSPFDNSQFIHKSMTYSALYDVQEKPEKNNKTKKVYKKVWETYSHNWNSQTQLPIWPQDTLIKNKIKWELAFIGVNQPLETHTESSWHDIIENVSHVSYLSIEK